MPQLPTRTPPITASTMPSRLRLQTPAALQPLVRRLAAMTPRPSEDNCYRFTSIQQPIALEAGLQQFQAVDQLLLALLLAGAGAGAALEVEQLIAQQIVDEVLGFAGAIT